jgi:hypothetical protein
VLSADKAACWIYGVGIVLTSDVCDGYTPLEGRCLNEMLERDAGTRCWNEMLERDAGTGCVTSVEFGVVAMASFRLVARRKCG